MKIPAINFTAILLFLLLFSVVSLGYIGREDLLLRLHALELQTNVSETKLNLASTTRSLTQTVNMLQNDLFVTKTERDSFEQRYNDEKARVDALASQVSDITGAVGTLQKLKSIDPELLKKYSKVYFLNEHYFPSKLIIIDERYTYSSKKTEYIHENIWPYLRTLLQDAENNSVDIKILSAFRAFGTQAEIKSSYTVLYGAGTANQFSADQGYSEHQLGSAVDFTTKATGANFSEFEKTKTYAWLTENAHKYGFILSYPKNNAYYRFEPWHWRFVGRSLAEKLHQDTKNFYDLDQRIIDTYLISFFD